jgi:hypothetical protein
LQQKKITKTIAMEKNIKEDQKPGILEAAASTSPIAKDRCDSRLPHEIAAVILAAAYEVVVKQLEWQRNLE